MISGCFDQKLIWLIICSVVGLCGFSGCRSPQEYKTDADKRVYNIINQKWQKGFGTKANYKISDTAPSPNDIKLEKAVPVSGVLTLPQAVALATAHNRDYQAQKEALYIKALDLRLVRHDFETQFLGGAGLGYRSDRNDEVFGLDTNFGFNQLLVTGARISTRIGLAWADVLTGNLRSGLASILTTTVAQPLLRGSDRQVILENLTQAERDTLYQLRSFNRFRKTFVVSIITQYYQVLQRLDTVKNARQNYNTLAWVYNRSEKLANAGRIPAFELDRIRQEKLQALDTYIQAEKQYKQALDEFKITLSLPTTAEFQLDDSELEALKAAGLSMPDFSEDEVIKTALSRRLDLANRAEQVADAERKVLVAADALRADLNLLGTISGVSRRRANRRTLQSLREEYGIDLELDLPFDRVAEQNIYRKALITVSQRQREYEQAADTVKLQVRQAYRDLTEAAQRYQVQIESLRLAEKRLKNTFLLLQYGRASTRRVLNAQQDLFDAQNAATDALVNYAIATLNFYRDTGVLGVRPDGMWQKNAQTQIIAFEKSQR